MKLKKRKLNFFDVVLNIILVLLAILVVYWLIQLIFGGSPGLNEFNFALIIFIGGFFIKMYRESGILNNEIKHLSKGVKVGFDNVRSDMNLIKKDMDLIKKKLKV